MRVLLLTAPFLFACTLGEEAMPKTASAGLESRSASTVTGTADFKYANGGVTLTLNVSGASVGQHGVHLHAIGDCSDPAAMSAQGHWNPDMTMHGFPGGTSHLGDCGNMDVGADGTGVLEFTGTWAIGTGAVNDIVGKAIIVHAAPDDGTTQMPPGNAGARQACGVIAMPE